MNPRDTAQQQRRQAILMAAIGVFAERGFQAATMEEIARRAGVAKGTPYLYFSDKADLFYAVFELWANEALTGVAQATDAATGAHERLQALAFGAVESIEAHREWFPLSLEVWAASSSPTLRDRFVSELSGLYARYRQATAEIIRAGQASGELRPELDVEAIAALLTGAIDGLLLQCWFDPSIDARRLLTGFFDGLRNGIAAPPKGEK